MNKRIPHSVLLRVLSTKLLGANPPKTVEVEEVLEALINYPPGKLKVSSWPRDDKEFAFTFMMIMNQKYSANIETLTEKILRIAYESFEPDFDAKFVLYFLVQCIKECKEPNGSLGVKILAMNFVGRIIVAVDQQTFLNASPGVLSMLLQSLLGAHSKKEQYIETTVKTLELYINRWAISDFLNIKAVTQHAEALRQYRHLEQVLQINTDVHLKSPPKPELQAQYAPTKAIADKIFEAIYLLTPAKTPASLSNALCALMPALFSPLFPPKAPEGSEKLTLQGLIKLLPFQVHSIESSWEGSSQDLHGMILDLVRDYVSTCDYNKQALKETLEDIAKRADRTLVVSICSHFEDFTSFVDSLPEIGSSNRNQIATLSIHQFSSKLKEYSAVEQPLSDLCSLSLSLTAILQKSPYLEKSDLVRCYQAVSGMKRVVEQYIDSATFKGIKRKVYLTILTVLSVYSLSRVMANRIALHTPDRSRLDVQLSEINHFVFEVLSTDELTDLSVSMVHQVVVDFAGRLARFSSQLGLQSSPSSEELSTEQGFIRTFSPYLTEQAKFNLLNYPAASAQNLNSLRLLTSLSRYSEPGLAYTLLPIMSSLFELFTTGPFQIALQRLAQQVLSSVGRDRTTLLNEAKRAEEAGEVGPGNHVRTFGLKAFAGLRGLRYPELLELVWSNMRLIQQVFDNVPMTVDQHTDSFSANDPANCTIENTAAAFFAEIWSVIADVVVSLCKAYLHEAGTLGNLAYEYGIARSKTRENYLNNQLKELLDTFSYNIDFKLAQSVIREVQEQLPRPLPAKWTSPILSSLVSVLGLVGTLVRKYATFRQKVEPLIPWIQLALISVPLDSTLGVSFALEAIPFISSEKVKEWIKARSASVKGLYSSKLQEKIKEL